jgi:hypothetical protein
VCTLLYACDVALNFFVAFYEDGVLVTDLHRIAGARAGLSVRFRRAHAQGSTLLMCVLCVGLSVGVVRLNLQTHRQPGRTYPSMTPTAPLYGMFDSAPVQVCCVAWVWGCCAGYSPCTTGSLLCNVCLLSETTQTDCTHLYHMSLPLPHMQRTTRAHTCGQIW